MKTYLIIYTANYSAGALVFSIDCTSPQEAIESFYDSIEHAAEPKFISMTCVDLK